jgi:hypothetical protein
MSTAFPPSPLGTDEFRVRHVSDIVNVVAQLASAHLKRLQPGLKLPAVWSHIISKVPGRLSERAEGLGNLHDCTG